jgi:hypothetical protein
MDLKSVHIQIYMDIEEDRLIFGIIIGYIITALLENRGWASINDSEIIYPNTTPILPDTIPNLKLG